MINRLVKSLPRPFFSEFSSIYELSSGHFSAVNNAMARLYFFFTAAPFKNSSFFKEQGDNVKKHVQKLISREFYRSPLFWGLSLIATYTLAGFFLLPKIIHNTLVDQVEQQLGWQTEVEKVEFNPYAFTLTIHNLKIADQQAQEQLSFERYHMNFELRSIIKGAFTFADIELSSPKIKLEIDKNGITNFQHAQQLQQAKMAPQPEDEVEDNTESAIPKLLFDNIDVLAGTINIIDHSPVQTVEHQLAPITFNLKNLFTYGAEEGNYHLNIALGNEQTLSWNGTIGVAPFRSNGSLKVDGIRMHRLWDYISDQVPYTLKHALVGFSGGYEVNMAGESTQLNIHQGMIDIDDIKLANKQQEQNFADIQAITIGPFDFDLAEKKLQADTVKIDAVSLKLERDKQGLLNILAPFAASETETVATDDTETAVSDSPFQWAISDFILTNSRVDFLDKQPTKNAQLAVNKIDFNIQGLSQDLSQNLPFALSYYVEQSGENRVNGQVSPVPLNLQARLAVDNLALPALQPYISDLAKVNLKQGKLSAGGELNLSNDKNGQIQGDFQGAFNINEFNTRDQALKKRLLGWQALAIDPIKINFNPLSIAISEIALTQPYVRFIVTEDRSTNFAQLVVNKDQDTEKTSDSKENEEKPLPITIDKVTVKDGGAYFADLSLQPQFGTGIQNMNGEIKGLSSDNLARADVNITGNIEEYGKMLVKGKINPLSDDLYTDIDADFDKIELSSLTPYSGRYAGYTIDKGKLSLHLNYKIANNLLDSSNHLILDQFELGSPVDSDESLNLPLKLALALFKDKNGIIDITLPVKGDMNDPDFAIGGLIMQAFVNIITKAVASPFSMLANLVEGDADELNSVAFALGSATLTEDQITQLNTLAEVLNKRPNLILEIRAMVDKELDGLALKQQKLETLLTESGADDVEQEKRISIIEQLLILYNGQVELAKLQSDMQAELSAIKDDTKENSEQLITDKYEQSLEQTLLAKQPLPSLELTSLAKQRISVIKAQLIKQGNVANKQVYALRSSLKGKAQGNTITTIFTLTTD